MQISAINSYQINHKNNTQPSFKNLIKCRSVLPIIDKLSEQDTLELRQIEKRLSKTKFWNMKISTIGNKFKELKFHFINKKDSNNIITDGIFPYSQEGNNIKFYSIIYGPENSPINSVGTLKFKSAERAKELFDTYQENVQYLRNINYNITPIESLKMKEAELNMLEEAYKNVEGKNGIKLLGSKYQTKATIGNNLFADE